MYVDICMIKIKYLNIFMSQMEAIVYTCFFADRMWEF